MAAGPISDSSEPSNLDLNFKHLFKRDQLQQQQQQHLTNLNTIRPEPSPTAAQRRHSRARLEQGFGPRGSNYELHRTTTTNSLPDPEELNEQEEEEEETSGSGRQVPEQQALPIVVSSSDNSYVSASPISSTDQRRASREEGLISGELIKNTRGQPARRGQAKSLAGGEGRGKRPRNGGKLGAQKAQGLGGHFRYELGNSELGGSSDSVNDDDDDDDVELNIETDIGDDSLIAGEQVSSLGIA